MHGCNHFSIHTLSGRCHQRLVSFSLVHKIWGMCLSLVIGFGLSITSAQAQEPDTTPAPVVNFAQVPALPSSTQNNIALAISRLAGYSDCAAVTPLNQKQLQSSIGRSILRSLHADAFFGAQIIALTVNETQNCHVWDLQLNLGQRASIASITLPKALLNTQDKPLTQRVERFLTQQHQPFSQVEYQAFLDDIYTLAIAHGYFDIVLGDSRVIVSEDGYTVDIDIDMTLGARYVVGELNINHGSIDTNLIKDLIHFAPSDDYHISLLNTLRQDLQRSAYFEQVSVQPDVPKRDLQLKRVPISITVTEKFKHYVDFGIGVTTDDGPRTSVSWTRPRINDAGHSIHSNALLSAPESHITMRYKIPFEDVNRDYFSVNTGLQYRDRNNEQRFTATVGAQRFFKFGPEDWQHNIFTRIEYNESKSQASARQYSQLLFFGFSSTRIKSDAPLYPTMGQRQTITFETTQDSVLSDFTLYQIHAKAKWLKPIFTRSDSHVVAWLSTLEGGYTHTDTFSDMPLSQRFFAGGDQSVRGFGFESLTPESPIGERGADTFVSSQQEWFSPVATTWAAAVFVDAVYAQQDNFEFTAKSAGIGAHWRSPVGPIRLYIARGSSDFETTWRVHLLMGPLL
ncbi:MAG: BamA/TamA family outer membrane protein [Glaciecola sp.]